MKTGTQKQTTQQLSYAPGSSKNPAVERVIANIIQEIECKVRLQLSIKGKVVDEDVEEGTWRYKVHGINFIHLLVRPDAGATYLVSLESRVAARLGKAFQLYSDILSEYRMKARYAVIFDLVLSADGPYAQPHELAEAYKYNAQLLEVDDSDKVIGRFIRNWTRRHDLGQCPKEEALLKFAQIYDPENQDELAQKLQSGCLKTALMAVYVTHPEYHPVAGEQPHTEELFEPNDVISLFAKRFLVGIARHYTGALGEEAAEPDHLEARRQEGFPPMRDADSWFDLSLDDISSASTELAPEDVSPCRLVSDDSPATENAPELEAISA